MRPTVGRVATLLRHAGVSPQAADIAVNTLLRGIGQELSRAQ